MILEEFRALLTQQVTVEPFVALDAYGEPTFGDPVTYRARVQQRAKLVLNAQGEQVTSMTQAFLWPTPDPLTIQDRITLPAGFVPTQPPILAISRSPDADGSVVVEIFC